VQPLIEWVSFFLFSNPLFSIYDGFSEIIIIISGKGMNIHNYYLRKGDKYLVIKGCTWVYSGGI
jgi:hypothetical protein